MLSSALLAFITVAIGATAWWWFKVRNEPLAPPIEIDRDDPLMQAATARARETLDELRARHDAGTTRQVQVKIPIRIGDGEPEHQWAQLLELGDDTMKVRYLKAYARERSPRKREHEHPLSDLEDWAVFETTGAIRGGFTQRVQFERIRAQMGGLPRGLAEQAARYVG